MIYHIEESDYPQRIESEEEKRFSSLSSKQHLNEASSVALIDQERGLNPDSSKADTAEGRSKQNTSNSKLQSAKASKKELVKDSSRVSAKNSNKGSVKAGSKLTDTDKKQNVQSNTQTQFLADIEEKLETQVLDNVVETDIQSKMEKTEDKSI